MKFAFIADIHLSRYSQDKIEDESNLPERLHSIRRALTEVAMYCKQNKIKHLIIGGDILHGKSICLSLILQHGFYILCTSGEKKLQDWLMSM